MLETMRLTLCALAMAAGPGCGIGAGVVALHGATTKTAGFAPLGNCRSVLETETNMGQPHMYDATECDQVGPTTYHQYNPNDLHFGALVGLKEGYASASYATGAGTSTSTGGQTIEGYFDFNVGFRRFGMSIEAGYLHQGLDDMTGLSFAAWPVSVLGAVRLGPLTVFGGIGSLRMSSLANDSSVALDVTGYRLLAGLKGHAFALFDDQIDVYPRLELQSTHAGDGGQATYAATGLSFSLELGF